MKIGKLAKTTGVSTQTIHFYEREGLLEKAKRGENGYRHYDAGLVVRVEFIRRCAEVGFTLREVGGLLDVRNDACAEVAEMLDEKIADLGRRIAAMGEVKRGLEKLRAQCDGEEKKCGALREIVG